MYMQHAYETWSIYTHKARVLSPCNLLLWGYHRFYCGLAFLGRMQSWDARDGGAGEKGTPLHAILVELPKYFLRHSIQSTDIQFESQQQAHILIRTSSHQYCRRYRRGCLKIRSRRLHRCRPTLGLNLKKGLKNVINNKERHVKIHQKKRANIRLQDV